MPDRSGRRQVEARSASRSGNPADVPQRGDSLFSDDGVSPHELFTSFYGRLDGLLPDGYRTATFGGVGFVGGAVLVLGCYARIVDSFDGASVRTLAVAFILLAFGSGYFVVRARSSCSACGADFARRRTEVRQIRRESDGQGPDEVYLEETFECETCGDRTTEPSSYSQFVYSQF